jgi:hypothetical protein
MILIALLSASLCMLRVRADAYGSYPSTYPFVTNGVNAFTLPLATPSFTYDQNDNGGYTITEGILKDGFASQAGPNFGMFPSYRYLDWYAYNEVGFVPSQVDIYNCTYHGAYVIPDHAISGNVGNFKVCSDLPTCCAQYNGLLTINSDLQFLDASVSTFVSSRGCLEAPIEAVYCAMVLGQAVSLCQEYVVTRSTRLILMPCYDNIVLYLSKCKVLSNPDFSSKIEPQQYLDNLSLRQHLILFAASQVNMDRVCLPHTYHFPSRPPYPPSPHSPPPPPSPPSPPPPLPPLSPPPILNKPCSWSDADATCALDPNFGKEVLSTVGLNAYSNPAYAMATCTSLDDDVQQCTDYDFCQVNNGMCSGDDSKVMSIAMQLPCFENLINKMKVCSGRLSASSCNSDKACEYDYKEGECVFKEPAAYSIACYTFEQNAPNADSEHFTYLSGTCQALSTKSACLAHSTPDYPWGSWSFSVSSTLSLLLVSALFLTM